jgi:hypothetical protein
MGLWVIPEKSTSTTVKKRQLPIFNSLQGENVAFLEQPNVKEYNVYEYV